MTIDCVAYLITYELHVLDVYMYGTSNAVLYCMGRTLQRLRAVCAATARLLSGFALENNLAISDMSRVSNVTTYISDDCAKATWIDHVLSSFDADKLITSMCDSWSVGLFDVSCFMRGCSDFLHTFCV